MGYENAMSRTTGAFGVALELFELQVTTIFFASFRLKESV
jgi:hypothetical protein